VVQDTLRFAKVGEPVAVWGWSPNIFAQGHVKMASRDTIGERVIEPRFDLGYYRERYLKEFKESDPQVFVDVIGLFMYGNRELFGWETFPAESSVGIDRDIEVRRRSQHSRYREQVKRSASEIPCWDARGLFRIESARH